MGSQSHPAGRAVEPLRGLRLRAALRGRRRAGGGTSALAATLDAIVAEIKQIQLDARTKGVTRRPAWADRSDNAGIWPRPTSHPPGASTSRPPFRNELGDLRLMVGAEPSTMPGASVLYIDAPDIDALGGELERRGVRFLGGVTVVRRTEKGDLKLREFEDPDGNALALMGFVPR